MQMCEDEARCPRLTAARATAGTAQDCSASPGSGTSTSEHDLNTNAVALAIPRIAQGTFNPVACAHSQGSFAAPLAFRELAAFARSGGLTESDVAFCKFCDCSLPRQDCKPRSCSEPRLKVLLLSREPRSQEHAPERQGTCARTAPARWFGLPFCRARCA